MIVNEYDLFHYSPPEQFPFCVCGGGKYTTVGCGAAVANTPEARALHVEFHNRVDER